jgi:hypothetical protein
LTLERALYRDLDRHSDLESAALAELSRRGSLVTSWSVRIAAASGVAAVAAATACSFVTAGPASTSENLVAHSMSSIAIAVLATAGLGAALHRWFLRRAVHRWKVEAHQRYHLEPEVLDSLANVVALHTRSTRSLLRGVDLHAAPRKAAQAPRGASAVDSHRVVAGEIDDGAAEREAEAESERGDLANRRRS